MADLSTVTVSVSNLLLAVPQQQIGYLAQAAPIVTIGGNTPSFVPTFVFDYEGENIVDLASDISDHYVETNIAVQDQIALKPEQVVTKGFVGELSTVLPGAVQPYVQAAQSVLRTLSVFTPSLTEQAQAAYSAAFQAYQTASDLAKAFSALALGQSTSQQQKYFALIYSYWQNRTLFTIQTPWNLFQNMAIASVRIIQDETTTTISDFQVTFKKINFAVTLPTANLSIYDPTNATGRAQTAGAVPTNQGASALTTSPTSFNTVLNYFNGVAS